jgi:hypothetical protein
LGDLPEVHDLRPLTHLPNLRNLSLYGMAKISDLQPFIMHPKNWTRDEDRMLCQCAIEAERREGDPAETFQR